VTTRANEPEKQARFLGVPTNLETRVLDREFGERETAGAALPLIVVALSIPSLSHLPPFSL